MILSDQSISEMIDDGRLGIAPEPRPEQVQPASLDVRIDDKYMNTESGIESSGNGEVRLAPSVPYIACTLDKVSLPNDVAAMLTGRSSVGRAGVIIHKTAGWIDPGFEGQITLEMMNFSDDVVTFEKGERVGQLVFFHLDHMSQGYDGQYQGQSGITR